MTEMILLEKRMKWSAVQNYLISLATLFFMVMVMAGVVVQVRAAQYSSAALMAFFTVMMALGTWVMFQSGRALWPLEKSALYQSLNGDAKNIAWVHLTTGRSTSVKVYLIDGESFQLYGNAQETQTLANFVRQRAPHALAGYGEAEQRAYAERVKQHKATVSPSR